MKPFVLKKSVGLAAMPDVEAEGAADGVSQGEAKKSGTFPCADPIPADGAAKPGPEGLAEIGQGLVFNCCVELKSVANGL